MSTFADFHKAALAEAVAFLGETFTYKGTSYKGVISDLEVTTVLQDGGLALTTNTVIVVQRSLIPVPPKTGEKLTVRGKLLRIVNVKRDEASYEITCETSAR